MSLLKNFILESISNKNTFDSQSFISKLKNSEKIDSIKSNSVGFVLEEIDKETNKTQLIKVYVIKSEAEDFEKALSSLLNEYKDEKEVAEIIFMLRSRFNIINVEWPTIEEDEEITQEIPNEENTENQIDDLTDETELNQNETSQNDNEIKSILQSIIDMMKADAEAKKAEAEAKISQHASTTALAKIKTEEELIDMENYYKEKEEKRKEIEKLAKLAKYKEDLKKDEIQNNDEINLNNDENILSNSNFSYENEEITSDINHFKNIDIYLKHNQHQR